MDDTAARLLAAEVESKIDRLWVATACTDYQALDAWCRLPVYVEDGEAPVP